MIAIFLSYNFNDLAILMAIFLK